MRHLITFAFMLSMLISASYAASGPGPLPKVGVTQDFIWTRDEEIPALIEALNEAGCKAVRMPIRWTVCEPERGKWDFSRMDRIIRMVRDHGISILAVMTSVPAWASGVDPKTTKGFWDATPPKDFNDFGEFVRKCVGRYKNEIGCWEIWNEEDGIDWYKPEPNAPEYVKLLKIAYKAAKKANPKCVVALGSLQMNGIIPNPWSPYKNPNFLQKLYDAGAKPYFDVVNIHPYVLPTPDQGAKYCANMVRDTVKVMRKNGDGVKPLWITETGCPVTKELTEQMQADHLTGIYKELLAIPEVKLVYWFCLHDFDTSITGGEDSMGLLDVKFRRKPAFEAFKKVIKAY